LKRPSKGWNSLGPAGAAGLPKGISALSFQLSGTPIRSWTHSSTSGSQCCRLIAEALGGQAGPDDELENSRGVPRPDMELFLIEGEVLLQALNYLPVLEEQHRSLARLEGLADDLLQALIPRFWKTAAFSSGDGTASSAAVP